MNDPTEYEDNPALDTMIDEDDILPTPAHVMTDTNVPVDVVTPELAPEGTMDPISAMIAMRPKRKRRSVIVMFCSAWLGLMFALAIFAPYLPFRDPAEISSEVKL